MTATNSRVVKSNCAANRVDKRLALHGLGSNGSVTIACLCPTAQGTISRNELPKRLGKMVRTRVGIRDVAAEAGVSVTTVSHILNEVEGKRVSAQTRARVREVAERLGYAPNGLARGLRLRRSNVLGFVSDEIATTPYAGEMILGAQEAAAARGLMLLLLNTGGDPQLERREIDLLLQRQVDGVLYAAMYHRIVELPERLRSVPTVLLDARSTEPTVSSVVPDEAQGGYIAVRELLDHG